ncbi:MAG: hypothetical protein ABJC89_06290 [Acidobacteriota bacterium]
MKTAVAALCALLVAPHAFAQSEEELKDFFEGKTVVVKLDMPATQTGVDVFADARRSLNFDDYRTRLKSSGIAIRSGESVMITKIRVKEKLIEFQLGGGGYGTFGDDTDTSGYVAGVPKSSREKSLERELKDERDSGRKRRLQNEIDDLRRQREREDQRNRAASSVATEEKKQRIAYQRLHGGSRFNVRYQEGVPRGVTAGGIMAALQEYVDFPFASGRQNRTASRPADADRRLSVSPSSLHKGMTLDDVREVLGEPDKTSEAMEGRMKVTSVTFSRGDQRVDAQFVDGVLVKYSISSR